MRELAITLARQHIACHLVIKGKVPADVLEVITPRAGISIASCGRWYFKPFIVFLIMRERLAGSLRCVIVNKERTLRWVSFTTKIVGCETVLLNERGEDIELADYQHRAIRPQDLARHLTHEDRPFL